MVHEIPLTRGYVALVDDSDYERVARHNWCAAPNATNCYATRGLWVDGKFFRIFMHRFILGLPDGIQVDHVDGDGLNNKIANLRAASGRQNALNKRNRRPDKFIGVYQVRGAGAFRASLSNDGQPMFLGSYATADEAARVVDAAMVRLRREWAAPNFPTIDPAADDIARQVIEGGKPPTVPAFRLLTPDIVTNIRGQYADGGRFIRDIASDLGVSNAAVAHILTGRTWSSVSHDDGLQERIDDVAQRQRTSKARLDVAQPEPVAA